MALERRERKIRPQEHRQNSSMSYGNIQYKNEDIYIMTVAEKTQSYEVKFTIAHV